MDGCKRRAPTSDLREAAAGAWREGGCDVGGQVDRARFLYRELVGNIMVFSGCSDSFLDALCVVVKEVHFNPEQPLFENNAHASQLFMIVVGSVETYMCATPQALDPNPCRSHAAAASLPPLLCRIHNGGG